MNRNLVKAFFARLGMHLSLSVTNFLSVASFLLKDEIWRIKVPFTIEWKETLWTAEIKQ